MQEAITVKDLKITYRGMNKVSIKRDLLRGGRKKRDDFEALKGISFSLEQGEILGIIGCNGSGKSTLLKTIAGVFTPDEGSVDLHGNSISLLSLGLGFNPQLTGRQNIELNGLLLGFSEAEVQAKMQDMIAFSELGSFIDKPVRTYSSGMSSKLAFSVASNLETDILLVDEVLSVGDEKFRKKSMTRMRELINDETRTVIIVSHAMATIRELCTKVLWIHMGEFKEMGDPETVVNHYLEFMTN